MFDLMSVESASGGPADQIVPHIVTQNMSQIAVQNEIQSISGEVRAAFVTPILSDRDHLSPSAPCYRLNTIPNYLGSLLGSGSFGTCYKLNHHPNVVSFFGYVISDEKGPEHPIGTLMEFMAGGDIYKYVGELHASKPIEFPLPPVLQNTWAKQIALGLNFIHTRNVMHRDIKPNNILLSHDRRVAKIADFGLSKNLEKEPGNQHTRKIGNWMYSAPEIYLEEEYNKTVDVYSYAMVLYFIYYQRHPFDPKKAQYACVKKIKGDASTNTPPLRPALSNPSLPIDELIANCWQSESNQRWTMPRVIEFLFDSERQQQLPALDA